jgi:cystathionine beta-lyase
MPMAKLSSQIAKQTITLIAPSKTFNVPGLFCAFGIIPNEELCQRYKATVYRLGFHISSPGLIAAHIAYSGQCDEWLWELREYLTDNRNFLVDYVMRYMPLVRITIPRATYLAWLDFSELKLEPSPYEFFLKEARVGLSDGGKFGKGSEQFIRLNFGTSRKILKQGLDRMTKALRSI